MFYSVCWYLKKLFDIYGVSVFFLSDKQITDATFDVCAIYEVSRVGKERQIRFKTQEVENTHELLMVQLSWSSVLVEYDSKRAVEKKKNVLHHKSNHKTPKRKNGW